MPSPAFTLIRDPCLSHSRSRCQIDNGTLNPARAAFTKPMPILDERHALLHPARSRSARSTDDLDLAMPGGAASPFATAGARLVMAGASKPLRSAMIGLAALL
jgi:hypothetical protein